MSNSQVLTIKGTLPTTNDQIRANRGNKYAGAEQKKTYTNLVAMLAKNQLEPIDHQVNIKCTWYLKNKRKDKDNISGGIKFILDGLVEAGVLENDGWRQIGDIYHTFKVDQNERVEVTLSKAG